MRCCLRFAGATVGECKDTSLMLRHSLLDAIKSDLARFPDRSLVRPDIEAIERCARNTALAASKQARRDDSVNVTSTKNIFGVKRTINEVLNMIEAKATKSRLQSQPCVHDAATSLTNGGGTNGGGTGGGAGGSSGGAVGGAAALHRLFGRFRSDQVRVILRRILRLY